MTRNMTQNMTQGKVSGIVLRFYLPLLLTNLLQQVYTFADTAIVGKGLGDAALAAVGNMSSLTFLITGFLMGLTNGFSVCMAHSFGTGDEAGLRKYTAGAIRLTVWLTAILTVLSIAGLRSILLLMQTPDSILRDSLHYGWLIFGGLFSASAYNLSAGMLRALGDSKTPFLAIIVSTVINVVLDIVSIFVLHSGVEGAAIATVAAQLFSAGLCCRKLLHMEVLHLGKEDRKPDAAVTHTLLVNGIPMACMNSVTAVGCIVVQYFVNGMGVAYTSAYSACSRYLSMFMLPGVTGGYTISAFAGQNDGAHLYGRIRGGVRVCLELSLGASLLLGSLMVFFPKQLAGWMLSGADVLALAADFLPMCGIMLFAVNFLFVFRSCVQGMGSPTLPMLSGILEMCIRVSVVVLLLPALGFRATALAEVLAWSGALLLNFAAYELLMHRRERRQCRMIRL